MGNRTKGNQGIKKKQQNLGSKPITPTPTIETSAPGRDKHFGLSDSIAIGAVIIAGLLWVFVPNLYTKIVMLVLVASGTAFLAYRSHWTRNLRIQYRHLVAFLFAFVIVGGGSYALWLEHSASQDSSTRHLIQPLFKESGYATPDRQRNITTQINNFYNFMADRGFTPPSDSPWIDVMPGLGTVMIETRHEDTRSSDSDFGIQIGDESLDDVPSILEAYGAYIFKRMLGIHEMNKTEPDFQNRQTESAVLATYYKWALLGRKSDAHPINRWPEILWVLRLKLHSGPLDKWLLYTLKLSRNSPVPSPANEDFDNYIYDKLLEADSATEQGGLKVAALQQVLVGFGKDWFKAMQR